ncbi:TetR/AcrR family transcriptional regulator [Bacillus sp. SB49]|nr:TetR/AcrR family transcriptional regulator [Bacillus sp. SB49]QHT47927.1 TetR/AcrR family transcriptional regulator [Bacillus sp. SB49]
MAMQKSAEKRERILQAAIQMFSMNGYSNATIKEVAKAAGVSFGTVFTYFENKEELFHASVLEPLEEVKAVMLASPEPSEEPTVQIRELIEQHVNFFAQQTVYVRLLQYVIAQRERFPDLFMELDQFAVQLRNALRPLIVKGQELGELMELEPDDVSDTYLAYVNGARLTFTETADDRKAWDMFTRHAYLLFGPRSL